MCYQNADELKMTFFEFQAIFPDGIPEFYTAIDTVYKIERLLPIIEKAREKDLKLWGIMKNAELAKKVVSCRIRGRFPLLDALRVK